MLLINNTIKENSFFSEKIFEKGRSIYEVIRIYKSHPIFLEDNLLRFSNSIRKSNIYIDTQNLHIEDKLNRLIELEHIAEGNIKYVLHFIENRMDEYIYQIPHHYPNAEDYRQGVVTISCRAMRNTPEIKYINNELREMTNRLLTESHAYEAILVDKEGYITEGSRSNLFFIREGIFYTAPTCFVLPGTARKRVLDICKRQNFKVEEKRVAYSDLSLFDAAFLTGTSPLVLPIRLLDRYEFSTQNPWLRKLMSCYFSLMNNVF